MICTHIPVVNFVAGRRARSFVDNSYGMYHLQDELFNNYFDVGVERLIVAVDTFDPKFGVRLTTYAAKLINQAISKENKRKPLDTCDFGISFEQEYSDSDLTRADTITSSWYTPQTALDNVALRSGVRVLEGSIITEKQRFALLMRLAGFSYIEIAEQMGSSHHNAAVQLINKAQLLLNARCARWL